ncbi:hypothetical protein A1D23_08290 [Chelonobacter oris]|uniref:hypothetical protein n=1 Tax=Chelonobacter oris TaxID=505317 RepID=UPI00244BC950|nr:hypothetical protein [Chelonobacter oris]MDH3000181.1 hypothetical protein [Chelonobacter oris]
MEHSMQRLNFDKLKFVKRLQQSGQTPEQAEAFAEAFDDALTQSQSALATKQDIAELKQEIKSSENRLLYAIGAAFIGTTTLLIALVKFL